MCGIAGVFSKKLSETNLIHQILADQHARGPDNQGLEKYTGLQSEIILGHNRLKIIDLTNQANQPMWDDTHQYCIVYNGEIYNYLELRSELIHLGHRFKSESDTEVILNAFKAWGIAALDRLNGPFAFAIFDKQNEKLWLIRDRFGVKPLFYYIKDHSIYFASSTKVIANYFNLAPNLEYVARGLKYFVYEDDSAITAYQELLAVPAAHYLEVSINQNKLNCNLIKYYDLQNRVEKVKNEIANYSEKNLLNLLLEKLQRAITIRLRADVPVGISLSGGLDSSSIAALIAKKQDKTQGFSFANPDLKTSEGPLVKELAKKIGLQVEYIWPSAHEVSENLLGVIKAQNAPFVNLSVLAQYLVYQKVRQAGIKVLLGGQGGDEGFMGYRKFHLFKLQQLFNQRNYFAGLAYFIQLLPLFAAELNQVKFLWGQRKRYLNNKLQSNLSLPFFPVVDLQRSQLETWHRQASDITRFSLPTLLRYEDRNSMAQSVESRLPFMDYQLLELGLALPEMIKLKKGYGKWCLREIMQHKIPESIRKARYKRGFDIPLSLFIKQGLGCDIRGLLEERKDKIREFLSSQNKINEIFSDKNLIQHPNLMGEVISLLWLAEV